jgi:hypothetical protein
MACIPPAAAAFPAEVFPHPAAIAATIASAAAELRYPDFPRCATDILELSP